MASLAAPSSGIRGATGDLVLQVPLPSSGVDVAVDPDGTRIWVLNETSGQIAVLGESFTVTGTIPHPFGPALFPFLLPRARGIARAPDRGTLFVLNATDRRIWEISVGGEPRNLPLDLALPPGVGAALWSLAYDRTTGTLWTIDEEADLLIELSPTSGGTLRTIRVPGDDPPETIIHGRGVEIAFEGRTPRLLISYGTIFDPRESRIRFLDLEGHPTGREVPLGAVGPGTIAGIGWSTAGGAERAIVLANPGTMTGAMYILNASAPAVLPPSDLASTVTLDGRVRLRWTNHGPWGGGAYDEIFVRRNDIIVDRIGGARTDWSGRGEEGVATYAVQGNVRFVLSPLARSSLRAGAGGIVRWRPFPGAQASGIAYDPRTGSIWAGDGAGDRIHRFDRLLSPVASIPSPFPEGSGAMVFLPRGADGGPCLVVASRTRRAILRISPEGDPLEAPRVADLGDPEASIVGLAPAPGGYLFALAGPRTRIVELSPEGMLLRACEPRLLGGIEIAAGLAAGPDPSILFAATSGGSIAEISIDAGGCAATGAFVHAGILGNAAGGDRIRGLAGAGETVLVVGGATNAIYEVLLRTVPDAFVRGDANDDLLFDLADAMALAMYLFRGGPPPPCAEAADANDDGRLDISDPIFIVWHLFAGGPPPPPPFPAAGRDPGAPDGLGCRR